MKKFAVAILTGSLLSGCVLSVSHDDRQSSRGYQSKTSEHTETGPAARIASRPAVINHLVFFKLTDASKADALVADCDKLLSGIPTVTSYFCGRHFDSGRDSVDDGYDVGLYAGFDSKEGYSAYLVHPDHLALVEKWGPDFAEVQVRDVYDGTP